MEMNRKAVLASLLVACLAIVSLGTFAAQTTDANSEHYTDIDGGLMFNETEGLNSAEKINKAVGSEVCNYNVANDTLTFTASCNLRDTSTEAKYFFGFFCNAGDASSIIVNKDVEVNISGADNHNKGYSAICAEYDLTIGGEGKMKIVSTDSCHMAAINIKIYKEDVGQTTDRNLTVTINELTIETNDKPCIGYHTHGLPGKLSVDLTGTNIVLEGKHVFAGHHVETTTISVTITDSTVKMSGTKGVFSGQNASVDCDKELFASTSYRATDLQKFDLSNIKNYQFISTENNPINSFVIPITIGIAVVCLVLFYFVFIHVQPTPWEQEKINAEKAKKKAEDAAMKAEMEKKRAAEKKIADERRAREKAEAEKRKAAEAKAKEAARVEAEKKKAEEAKKKEAARVEAEKRKAAEAKAKEAARVEAEKKKAEEAKKKAEEKAAKKAAEAKAKEAARVEAEKKKAEEAKRKAEEKEARKAIEAKKTMEAKQKAEAKKAMEAKKAAEKKMKANKK